MANRQELMTREAFAAWLTQKRVKIHVWPHEIVSCRCGDCNCHGWRLVRWIPLTDDDGAVDPRLRRSP
jgi:hypothetical protein